VFNDKLIVYTTQGFSTLHHLTWLESLGDLSDSKEG